MKKTTILWADDDVDDLLLMKDVLEKYHKDYDVVEVANGREALDYLEVAQKNNSLPSLVILDINMPVMDGKETLAVIKRTDAFKELPVVVFSTSNSELDKLFCKRMKVDLITKPPDFKLLEKAILRLLNHVHE
jgi:CheY-like chemotaxis protein